MPSKDSSRDHPRLVVLGSLNWDMITRVEAFPAPGQTVTGLSFAVSPGGKGANQAVALARLGARVSLVGALGDDAFGRDYRVVLENEGVDTTGVQTVAGTSGTATILVDKHGENQIVVVPGANESLGPNQDWDGVLEGASAILLQLEVPLDTVTEAARQARARGVRVILDPAPARPLPPELLANVDVITPNQTEAAVLTGLDASTDEGIEASARALVHRGVALVVVKAGARGAYLASTEALVHVPGFTVATVDTVAAGDSFNAGLAFALDRGDAPEAVRFANAVAALSTTQPGAQGAMPSLEAVEALISPFGR